MDYEKAYKAAKRLAAHWIENGCEATEKILLETIFPELKESKDERIRKAILGLTYIDGIVPILTKCSITAQDIRTYLEKHKKQKPAECIEDSVKFKEGFKAGRDSGLRDGQKYVLDNLDSYGLCKPAEWSEEDDMLMDELESYILYDKEFNNEQRTWRIKRLKSLRPQSHWRPSETQMWALQAIINNPNNAGAESCQLALKSLLEQFKNGETK